MTPKRPSNAELIKVYKFFLACKSTLRETLFKESMGKDKTQLLENMQRFEWEFYHVLEREYYHLKNDVNVDEHKKAPLNLEC